MPDDDTPDPPVIPSPDDFRDESGEIDWRAYRAAAVEAVTPQEDDE